MNVVRYADRPDLMARRYDELTKPTFPEYTTHIEPGDLHWGRLYTDFPDFHVALVDGDGLLEDGTYVFPGCLAPVTFADGVGTHVELDAWVLHRI